MAPGEKVCDHGGDLKGRDFFEPHRFDPVRPWPGDRMPDLRTIIVD